MKKIHFIALGGSVMHQLAIALNQKGYYVTGSDDEIFEPARSNLERAGLLPDKSGWHPERITPGLDTVILGMHAREDNPELIKARSMHIPILSFPEYIYEESIRKTRVVIGGSHGKTTITAMILHVLKLCGKDFDYLVGAHLPGFENSVKISDAPVIICEGDEYPASTVRKIPKFLFYHPQIAVLSGIAWDHINVFPTFENYQEQFLRFIRELKTGSKLIYNENDPNLARLVIENGKHVQLIPYALPRYRIQNGVTVLLAGNQSVPLQVFGMHNLQNISAAKCVCTALGVDEEEFLHAISSFKGASRRLEKVFESGNSALFRDFAHAPSKVKASVHALKEQFPGRKLIAVLELHTYSSLNTTFLPEYRHALDEADMAGVFYSNHAMEIKRLPSFPADIIRREFGRKDLNVMNNADALREFLKRQPADNSNLLMMSSGSFEGVAITEMIELWQKG
jgi:UDP-N-acetylmuramate: L-alanyl-gamma-D-glutamyl-meso-diaminopimelate ligase